MTQRRPRLRFAPSPTGVLHVGGARTALYNWLYARKSGGSFILRMEDTDQSRSTEQSIKEIEQGLNWLGLDWDEGPSEAGERGEFGPYRQTLRLDIYREYIDRLLNSGDAYFCWCSPEELEKERETAREKGEPYRYSRACRGLSADEQERIRAERGEPVIRFSFAENDALHVDDLVRGPVTFDSSTLSDFVIRRADGMPTYNFVVVIDDILMEITHVIRGEDHLPNTPKQMAIFKALGTEAPSYAHLPMIIGHDRKPLSKRHGSVSIDEFRKQGYLPDAIINYLALLGWSFDDATTVFKRHDLIEAFSVEKVGKSPAVFDNDKFLWMNGVHIRECDDAHLSDMIISFYGSRDGETARSITLNEDLTQRIVPFVKEKIKTLIEFEEIAWFFYKRPDEDSVSELITEDMGGTLRNIINIIRAIEAFEVEEIDVALRELCVHLDVKPKKVFQPIRFSVSGQKITPGIFETLFLLGKEETLFRLEAALDSISVKR